MRRSMASGQKSVAQVGKLRARKVKLELVSRDSTEHKKTEDALRESELKYRSLFKNMLNGFAYCKILLDENYKPVDFIYLDVNDAFEKLTGLKKENVLGKKVTEAIPGIKDSHPDLFDIYGEVALTGKETKFDIFFEPLEIWLSISVYSPQKGYFVAVFENITGRKKAEQALHQSEEKYKDLFENAREAIVTVDLEAKITGANKLVEEYGFKRQELIGKKLFDFVPEYERARAVRDFEILLGGKAVKGQMDVITSKGIITVEYRDNPIVRQGQVIGVQAILTDITERKRAEQLVRKERDKAQKYLDVAAVMLIAIDSEQRVGLINKKGCEILGYNEEEILAKNWFDNFLPDSVRGQVRDIFEKSVRGEIDPPEYYENPILTKSGQERLVAWHNTILRDDKGKVAAVLSSGEDITERKKSERQLTRTLAWQEAIFEGSRDAVFITDEDSRFVAVNRAACELTGYSKEELLHMRIPDLHEPEDLTAYNLYHDRIMAGEEIVSEAKILRKDRTKVDTEFNNRCIKISGTPYMHTVARDVTERKKAEQKLREHEVKLKALASQLTLSEERERRRIATELHDRIGQSLAVSKIKLDGLRHSVSPEDPLKVIEQVSSSLSQAIADIRSLTFDLSSPILHELGFEAAVAAWLVDKIEQEHGISTEFEDDEQAKPLSNDIRAILFRNVRELLFNVIKHAHAHKVKVSIRRIGSQVSVSVQDDGVGFDATGTWSTTTRKGGFGLFSIRERLEQLGGHLQIESAPGRGCTVTMTAPIKNGGIVDEKI